MNNLSGESSEPQFSPDAFTDDERSEPYEILS
jgi:hypothetical protein